MVFSVKLGVLPRPHLFRRKEKGHEETPSMGSNCVFTFDSG